MSTYAFLRTPLDCPSCGTRVHDEVWFQWGFCRGAAPHPGSTYVIGDRIRWHAARDGRTPAWTYFSRGGAPAGGNLGTPDVLDLIARDDAQDWLRAPCPRCGALLDGAAVEISGGVIRRGWLTRPGELPADATILVLEAGRPRPSGWDDHPMQHLSED